METVTKWPENVPGNIRHGQVWLVRVVETGKKTFEASRPRDFLALVAQKPEVWPGDRRLVRSRLALGDVEKLGIQGAVANMHWLMDNFMHRPDWVENLGEHQGSAIEYLHPFDLLAPRETLDRRT